VSSQSGPAEIDEQSPAREPLIEEHISDDFAMYLEFVLFIYTLNLKLPENEEFLSLSVP
jgi:hypothetical protein